MVAASILAAPDAPPPPLQFLRALRHRSNPGETTDRDLWFTAVLHVCGKANPEAGIPLSVRNPLPT